MPRKKDVTVKAKKKEYKDMRWPRPKRLRAVLSMRHYTEIMRAASPNRPVCKKVHPPRMHGFVHHHRPRR